MNINNPTTFSSPALVYSTSNSSGTSGALRADDTLAIFSTTTPVAISTSTVSSATGDNAFGSREDHVHGSTAISVVATAAEMRTATSNTPWASPGSTQYHPGVCKAWLSIEADGTLESPDYNIATVGDTGTGNRDINFTLALTSAVFAVGSTSLGDSCFFRNTARTTADFTIEVMNAGNTGNADVASTHIVAGSQ